VTIDGELTQIAMYNYSQQYGYKIYDLEDGKVDIEVYPPAKELYAILITSELTLPVIMTPGEDVSLFVSTDQINFGEDDQDNALLLDLESYKWHAQQQGMSAEEGGSFLASAIVEKMQQHPGFIGFLFYTDFWDYSHWQMFQDYTESMLDLYPLNFKANEMYARLRND
jgi:hypothetical protein